MKRTAPKKTSMTGMDAKPGNSCDPATAGFFFSTNRLAKTELFRRRGVLDRHGTP